MVLRRIAICFEYQEDDDQRLTDQDENYKAPGDVGVSSNIFELQN